MPRDSQGNFSNVYNWNQDAANGIGIEADRHQEGDDDQAQGLTDSLDRKGRGGMQAALAMGNFSITQLDEGAAATDGLNIAQAQKATYSYDATETGAADAYVIQLSPAPSAYTDGLRAAFIPGNSNTGASTLQIGGLTPAPAIQWQGQALTGGEIDANGILEVMYSGGAFQILSPPKVLPVDKGGTGDTIPLAYTSFQDLADADVALGNDAKGVMYRQVASVDRTVTLPNVNTFGQGVVGIKRFAGSGLTIVEPFGSQGIDGSNSPITLTGSYEMLQVGSDGLRWWILSRYGTP